MLERKPACCCTSNAYGLAASRGRLEVLQWLRRAMPQLGCPNWAVETAAAAGHVEVKKTITSGVQRRGRCPESLYAFCSEAVCFCTERSRWRRKFVSSSTFATGGPLFMPPMKPSLSPSTGNACRLAPSRISHHGLWLLYLRPASPHPRIPASEANASTKFGAKQSPNLLII